MNLLLFDFWLIFVISLYYNLYLKEFLEKVNAGITEALKKENAPLVIAGVDKISSVYKEINTYAYI